MFDESLTRIMPTFKATIRKQQLRRDGKYPVSIRMTHNRVSTYIPTGLYVSKRQVSKYYEIKDQFVLERTNQTIREYEQKLLTLNTEEMRIMPVRSIAAILTRSNNKVDYTAYCEKIIAENPFRYHNLKNALSIVAEMGYGHLMARDVDRSFIQKFRDFIDKKEISVSSVGKKKETKKKREQEKQVIKR